MKVGIKLGVFEGPDVGMTLGGGTLGTPVGIALGNELGPVVGWMLGTRLGPTLGLLLGI